MAVKLGVCYCEVGIMSTCVANSTEDQFFCDYFDPSSTNKKKCMNRDEQINNHCWSPGAQAFGQLNGVVRRDDLKSVPHFEAPVAVPTTNDARRTCMGCGNLYGCPFLPIKAAGLNKSLTSLIDTDYWNIGTSCANYISDADAAALDNVAI
jgi:hypothetical protein